MRGNYTFLFLEAATRGVLEEKFALKISQNLQILRETSNFIKKESLAYEISKNTFPRTPGDWIYREVSENAE